MQRIPSNFIRDASQLEVAMSEVSLRFSSTCKVFGSEPFFIRSDVLRIVLSGKQDR